MRKEMAPCIPEWFAANMELKKHDGYILNIHLPVWNVNIDLIVE